ncbi:MAG: L-lactate permease [Selenomonadaceae bacterium]|nr:L-lactate permease [Selenomonadaceae bacterium]
MPRPVFHFKIFREVGDFYLCSTSTLILSKNLLLASIFLRRFIPIAKARGFHAASLVIIFLTVGIVMFAPLQFETARILDLSTLLIVALQNQGGAIGNMICINNIVAVCATTGISGVEGKLIRTNFIPWFCFYVVLIFVALAVMSFDILPKF